MPILVATECETIMQNILYYISNNRIPDLALCGGLGHHLSVLLNPYYAHVIRPLRWNSWTFEHLK